MADNVPITPGTGEVISTEQVSVLNGIPVDPQQVQRIIPAIKTSDGVAADITGDQSNGIDVDVTRIQGTVTTDGSGHTQPVSAVSLPLPTGAAIAANQQTDALTNTQLRATPVPVSTGLNQPTTPTDTQPVSAASLPLPSGASTSAKQDVGNTSLSSIDGKIIAVNTGAVVVSSSALPTGAATSANQTTGNSSLSTIATNTGNGATSANQTNGTQQTKITDGTDVLDVLANDTGFNGISVNNPSKTLTFTTSTSGAQTILPNTDCRGYSWIEVVYTSVGSGLALTGQFSTASGGTYVNSSSWQSSNGVPNQGLGVSSGTIYAGPVRGNFFQIAVSALTSGTFTGTVTLRAVAPPVYVPGAQQVGTWTVGSNSATGSAVPANAFYIAGVSGGNLSGVGTRTDNADGVGASGTANNLSVSSRNTNYNGTNWDRTMAVSNGTNSTGTGITAAGIIAQFDDTSPTSITENQFGNVRMSANRNLYGTIRDAAGNERGANVNASNQLSVSVDNSNVSTNISQMNGVTVSMGAGATGTGVQRVVLANDSGKTLLSASGSASSSGNNTIVTAGTNKLKVYAFSLSTTSTTAITVKFQSGASGTDLWSVVLQAPTSVSTGANLVVQPPAWLFATASATLLNLNLSSANTVQWSVSYFDEA